MGDVVKKLVSLFGVFLFLGSGLGSREEERIDPFNSIPRWDGCQIEYRTPDGELIRISRGLQGFNVAPREYRNNGRTWLIWEIVLGSRSGIGLYDTLERRRRVLFPDGILDIGQIEPVWGTSGRPEQLIYLAKRDRIDMECLDLESGRINAVTDDGKVEHGFSLRQSGNRLFIDIELIHEKAVIEYDLAERKTVSDRRTARHRPHARKKSTAAEEVEEKNDTYLAFGDSITWGKMYLPDLFPGENKDQPELAYPHLLHGMLEQDGFVVEHWVRGHPGKTTEDAVGYVDNDLEFDLAPFSTLIVMFGTNDVYDEQHVLIEQSLENMGYIIDAAQERGMRVLACTIPPRNDRHDNENTRARCVQFNTGMRELVPFKGAELVEVYDAFAAHNPPEGWKNLLEIPCFDMSVPVDSGCHPNPDGHALMADLMMELYDPEFVRLSPPRDITAEALAARNGILVGWEHPGSWNIDHYRMEFGSAEDQLSESIELNQSSLRFVYLKRYFSPGSTSQLFRIVQTASGPMLVFYRPTTVYFRLVSVSTSGRESSYSEIYSFDLGK